MSACLTQQGTLVRAGLVVVSKTEDGVIWVQFPAGVLLTCSFCASRAAA